MESEESVICGTHNVFRVVARLKSQGVNLARDGQLLRDPKGSSADDGGERVS